MPLGACGHILKLSNSDVSNSSSMMQYKLKNYCTWDLCYLIGPCSQCIYGCLLRLFDPTHLNLLYCVLSQASCFCLGTDRCAAALTKSRTRPLAVQPCNKLVRSNPPLPSQIFSKSAHSYNHDRGILIPGYSVIKCLPKAPVKRLPPEEKTLSAYVLETPTSDKTMALQCITCVSLETVKTGAQYFSPFACWKLIIVMRSRCWVSGCYCIHMLLNTYPEN